MAPTARRSAAFVPIGRTGEANDLLGDEHGATVPGETALAAARKALELLSIGLIAAGVKRLDP